MASYRIKALKQFYGYTGYFQIYSMPFKHLPLFDYSEKGDLYKPDGINSGTPIIFDHLREQDFPLHMLLRLPDRQNDIFDLMKLSAESN